MRCGYTGEGKSGLGRECVLSCTEGGFTLVQNLKTLGSVCLHIVVPKDVLGGEPQEVCSEQHSSLSQPPGRGPWCAVSCAPVFSLLQCPDYGFRDLLGSLFGVFCTGI